MATDHTSPLNPRRQIHPGTLGQASGRDRLAGRRIVVVGAGQREDVSDDATVGIGHAVARLFAREGAALTCVDMDADALARTCGLLDAQGTPALQELADVRDTNALKGLLARCKSRMGGFDGLVLNVGMSRGAPFGLLSAQSWDDELAVNLRSHMLLAQLALPLLSPGSAIVLMSSIAALTGLSHNPAYEASKAAQLALARSIAVAGEGRGIRCNAVLPGLMDTPMGRQASGVQPARATFVPFGRQGTAWEAAYACLFLISHEASYVNGHSLVVDGGLTAGVMRMPALVDTSINTSD
ncbi:MAG: SDR family oxidoreductase [Aquabacterium sp.]